MATLIYNSILRLDIDDRILAHLQIVIGAKLRRQESFYLTLPASDSHKRQTVWLSHTLALAFEYDLEFPAPINREWLEILSVSANSSQGMMLIAEPVTDPETLGRTPRG